jgi:hypothetical protein
VSQRTARHDVGAHVVRLEDRAELVILLLRDGVVEVVVALGAVERDAEERLARVLDDVLHPGRAVELVIAARQEPRRAGRVRVGGAISSAASISRTMRSYGLSAFSDSTIQSRHRQMCGWL